MRIHAGDAVAAQDPHHADDGTEQAQAQADNPAQQPLRPERPGPADRSGHLRSCRSRHAALDLHTQSERRTGRCFHSQRDVFGDPCAGSRSARYSTSDSGRFGHEHFWWRSGRCGRGDWGRYCRSDHCLRVQQDEEVLHSSRKTTLSRLQSVDRVGSRGQVLHSCNSRSRLAIMLECSTCPAVPQERRP